MEKVKTLDCEVTLTLASTNVKAVREYIDNNYPPNEWRRNYVNVNYSDILGPVYKINLERYRNL